MGVRKDRQKSGVTKTPAQEIKQLEQSVNLAGESGKRYVKSVKKTLISRIMDERKSWVNSFREEMSDTQVVRNVLTRKSKIWDKTSDRLYNDYRDLTLSRRNGPKPAKRSKPPNTPDITWVVDNETLEIKAVFNNNTYN